MITANYVYNVAKPDSLTMGSTLPSLYFDQLLQRKEVKVDWRKFTWLESFERSNNLIYMRSDTPFKTKMSLKRRNRQSVVPRARVSRLIFLSGF